jgi:hypothetical protein
MPRFRVFHAIHPTFHDSAQVAVSATARKVMAVVGTSEEGVLRLTDAVEETHKLVAVVSAPDLEAVFTLTNSIDDVWWKNPGVEVIERSRSTSVGDVVEDENGARWLCEGIGWRQL